MKPLLGWLGLTALLAGCQSLPSLEGRSDSERLAADTPSSLAAAIRPQVEAQQPLSGLYTLDDGLSAFAARVALADMAEHSLDIQYYIWRNDTSGRLMIQHLYQAAERGVRVRVLLDDNNTAGMDKLWAALDMHPQVEVRLFNPFANRRWRALGYVTDFKRLNRRMHNKSFTADNQATIIGGRNIGDEYFDFGDDTLFIDLDVLAVGPVVDAVSADFDRYWNSASAYPLDTLVREPAHIARKTQRLFNGAVPATKKAQRFTRAWQDSPLGADLQAGRLPFEWAQIELVSDDPAKVLDKAAEQDSVLMRLDESMGTPQRSLWLVSPYFVPTDNGVAALTQLVQEGVDVHVLTNSLAATDVTLVHSGYAPHRAALLHGGVQLYELKPIQHSRGRRDRGLVGSSASSLHAKTFAIDGERLFVGSFNFDPRSAHLNTEMGLVIHSPSLAQNLSQSVNERLAETAYRLERTPSGKVVWQDTDEHGHTRTLRKEPAPWWRRLLARVASWLPLEQLL
ncbi:putative cardiolipin synthase [Neisseria sp. HSC-16F19]|nr:phospholipase D family protein [Neisseria sp. HSC-16F19]MCP2039704.1 putative cardiolipin synthase [Neisseria sp. HSC-16F19]